MTELKMARCCRMFVFIIFRPVVDRLSYCRGLVALTQVRAREMLRSGVHGTLEIVGPHPAISLGGFGVHEEVCHSQSTSHDALRIPHIRPRHHHNHLDRLHCFYKSHRNWSAIIHNQHTREANSDHIQGLKRSIQNPVYQQQAQTSSPQTTSIHPIFQQSK